MENKIPQETMNKFAETIVKILKPEYRINLYKEYSNELKNKVKKIKDKYFSTKENNEILEEENRNLLEANQRTLKRNNDPKKNTSSLFFLGELILHESENYKKENAKRNTMALKKARNIIAGSYTYKNQILDTDSKEDIKIMIDAVNYYKKHS